MSTYRAGDFGPICRSRYRPMSIRFRCSVAIFSVAVALLMVGCAVEKTSNPLSPSVAGPIPGVDITTPAMVQPANHARIAADQQPITLTIGNASSTGQRPLSYRFEIASDVAFNEVLVSRDGVPAGTTGQTSHKLGEPLAADRVYYWHARAQDGANAGAYWSPRSSRSSRRSCSVRRCRSARSTTW